MYALQKTLHIHDLITPVGSGIHYESQIIFPKGTTAHMYIQLYAYVYITLCVCVDPIGSVSLESFD